MEAQRIFGSTARSDDEHWISVSDLMAGLMVIFLFVAISYMRDVVNENDRMERIAITWNETQDALYEDLQAEFEADLVHWNAVLDRESLAVRFREPDVLFNSGEANLKPRFMMILAEFFPRYLAVLRSYRDDIDEVRLEGHTSSVWDGARDPMDGYLKNMRLSQDRTRSVLGFCLQLSSIESDRSWARDTITANGLSSSRLVTDDGGREDEALSRRVEFRVRTNADREIVRILRES